MSEQLPIVERTTNGNHMKVSIITVCFNSAETLTDTIESVRSQDYGNIEYIVVDGGSSDGTHHIIHAHRDSIDHVISEPDRGIYDAMNKGIAAATGDVVGILNSDDFYEKNTAIREVVEALQTHPNSAMVFGDVVFVKPPNLERITRHYKAQRFKPWMLRFGWMPPHPATFVRKQAYQEVGKYDLTYRISADYEFFVRALLVRKLKISRVDSVLVRMRAGGASTNSLRASWTLNREIVKACRVNGIYTNLALVLTKVPFKLFELRR